jgi:hypothetical protein
MENIETEYVTIEKDIIEDLLSDSINSIDSIEDDDSISDSISDIKPNDKMLSEFLEDINSSLQYNTITEMDKQRLGEFYMACKFNQDRKVKRGDYTEEDMIKFLFMGWFIYSMMLKDRRF